MYDEYPDSLEDDYFTRALIALCFENMNLPDDARIEYDRLAESLGRSNVTIEPDPQGKGELILFVAQGWIPRKVSNDVIIPPSIRISIPSYEYSSYISDVTIRSDNAVITTPRITTDLGDVTRKSLDDRAAQYLTRQTLRAGVKEAIAEKIGDQSEIAEVLARVILFLSEEADTRSWETLPGSLTLLRIGLALGIHSLEVSSEYSGAVYLNGIDVPEGKRLYRSLRF